MIIIYILIFFMGCVLGSFFSLAVYRIPIGENITYKRSHCTYCNHKLEILDLIPIFSFMFLKGKCRYCNKPLRIRYILLEVLSGITFLLFFLSTNINFLNIEINEITYLIFGFLYISGLFIIAGIDKEKREIQKSVALYQLIILTMYILYLYIVEFANIYRYSIYLILILALILLDTYILKRYAKTSYIIQILTLIMYMLLFTNLYVIIATIVFAIIIICVKIIIQKLLNLRKYKSKYKIYINKIPLGFYLCISNIIILIGINFFKNYYC